MKARVTTALAGSVAALALAGALAGAGTAAAVSPHPHPAIQDVRGDSHGLPSGGNVPTADLLASDITINSTTITFMVRTAAIAPPDTGYAYDPAPYRISFSLTNPDGARGGFQVSLNPGKSSKLVGPGGVLLTARSTTSGTTTRVSYPLAKLNRQLTAADASYLRVDPQADVSATVQAAVNTPNGATTFDTADGRTFTLRG